jgi:hypothetical protein
MGQRTTQAYEAVQRALQKERAAALGRIGRALEARLTRLGDLRARWDAAAPDERRALARAYAECRAEARRYRWYLEVQREAVGLRHHHDLDRAYPIPPALEP